VDDGHCADETLHALDATVAPPSASATHAHRAALRTTPHRNSSATGVEARLGKLVGARRRLRASRCGVAGMWRHGRRGRAEQPTAGKRVRPRMLCLERSRMVKSQSLGVPPSASAAPARSAGGALAAPLSMPATPPSAVAAPPSVTVARSRRSPASTAAALVSDSPCWPRDRLAALHADSMLTVSLSTPVTLPRLALVAQSPPWTRARRVGHARWPRAPARSSRQRSQTQAKVAAALQSWMNGGYGRESYTVTC
jgi:hypothetical protein